MKHKDLFERVKLVHYKSSKPPEEPQNFCRKIHGMDFILRFYIIPYIYLVSC